MDSVPLLPLGALQSLQAVVPVLDIQPMDAAQIAALAVALLALLISGFVSGSEIAYFSLTTSQLEDIEKEPNGQRIIALVKNPERLLATILIANNLVNVAIVVLCNFALGPIFRGMGELLSFLLQTVILTFLILLFGEILPKLVANNNNVGFARFGAGALSMMVALLRPLSAILVKSSGLVKHIVSAKEEVTPDELSKALELTDVKTDENKEMLEGILKFGDTTADEIMTPRVDITGVDISLTFDEVMNVVIGSGYSRMPAFDHTMDNIKGVLYARDLLPYVGKASDTFDWHKLLRDPYYVPESRQIDDLLEDFRRRRQHLAIVVDEFGGTQGLVTMEDVLEEIVGDINDEYDAAEEERMYRKLPDDTYIFEGKTLLGDFFRITGLNEDEYEDVTADCETLAGMLLTIKGDFPKEKESLVYGHCRFLVLDIEQHRIGSIRVKIMPEIQSDSVSLPLS